MEFEGEGERKKCMYSPLNNHNTPTNQKFLVDKTISWTSLKLMTSVMYVHVYTQHITTVIIAVHVFNP